MAERVRARAAQEYDARQAGIAAAKAAKQAKQLERTPVAPLANVPKLKARMRGPLGELKINRDMLAKVEYAPQNDHIGLESMGFQSCRLASYALWLGQLDIAAIQMVQEHLDLRMGITRMTALISYSML